MANDKFADIAAGYKVESDRGLISIVPENLPQHITVLHSGDKDKFDVYKKMDTKEELYEQLKQQREYYQEYLQDLAPKVPSLTKRTEIKNFKFSLDGSDPVDITIPHYDGPTGKHTAVYCSEFYVDNADDKAVILMLKGVDYIAQVFVNGVFIGNHEGFFEPFEFDITDAAKIGVNTLRIIVKNDFVMMGNTNINGEMLTGDKIYAATGLGWNDPKIGWHHCPPGFGIYNHIFVEIREKEYITDIFPRVTKSASEVWIECFGTQCKEKNVYFELSLYGQNFSQTVFENLKVTPSTNIATGVGDTLTEAKMIAEGKLGKGIPLLLGNGYNRFILPISIDQRKIWTPKTPYLYQLQVKMYVDDKLVSVDKKQFGIRDFYQDLESSPKGKFFLNDEEIRLRGANTMGFEQQDVMRGDFEQLIDDIILAKLCNLNFLRLTQRPVQEEIYDYCDKLGLMIQTDMPLFGTIRINQYTQTLKQVEAMEKLVRSHPCCIIDSYINEPFPNSSNMPHRMITRKVMMNFFNAADDIVKMNNPERVTKHVDGDYDPPSNLMPDNHCYTMWYNGHGLDMGKLHKGYWLDVFPDWYCGCGEFGAEGLDFCDVMKSEYPKEWLSEPFDPQNIVNAQTGNFHYFFYETPNTMEKWVAESHRHQYFATKLMTSALRRNKIINTFAIHLFIDAWPSGWMKTIMDCKRTPKPAFFAYRNCLSEVFCDLRSDRFTFFENEDVKIESYLVSDIGELDYVSYMVKMNDEILYCGKDKAKSQYFQGYIEFKTPKVSRRSKIQVYMGAFKNDKLMDYALNEFEVFPYEKLLKYNEISYEDYDNNRETYDLKVENGEKVILAPLSQGKYKIADSYITVTDCGMGPLYFVSRNTNHSFVKDLLPNDLGFFYNSKLDRLAPIIYSTFQMQNPNFAVTSGNQDENGNWHSVGAIGEINFGKGSFVVNQLHFCNMTKNPAIVKLMNNIQG